MFDKYLISHCSPTLASLKTANLFTYNYTCENELQKQIEVWNDCFVNKGINLYLLKKSNNKALIYVYRKKLLEEDLNKKGVKEFSNRHGYEQINIDYALEKLASRLSVSECFPHEIGLFLDYPLGDVIGFIENDGKNCKCAGLCSCGSSLRKRSKSPIKTAGNG